MIKLLKNKSVQKICLIVEILISVIVFATLTGGTGVDFDEAFSWDVVVNHGIKGILAATAADVHPPLYYLIVKASFAIFGESIKVMVWTSIFPVILGMIMSSVLVTRRWGFQVAFLFNFVCGFAPVLLHFNLNLRMYTWMIFFVLGVYLISYEMIHEAKTWHFIALFIFSICAVYTQYFALLPIVVCYIWLLIGFLCKKDWKSLVRFLIVGVLDVVSYVPWLLYGMKNMGIGVGGPGEEYKYYFAPSVIFKELFESNLENGDVMAMILFITSVLVFILLHKRFTKHEKSFLVMTLVNMVFCWFFSQWLGSLNGHFFHPRYVLYCLVFMWLFMLIVFSRFNMAVLTLFAVWVLELSFSSYRVEKAWEYETTPLMPHTVEFIEANVDPDAIIVYDYDKLFYLIWQYYMPGHEYIHFQDLNLDEMRGKTFWVINLSGAGFSQEEIDEYSLEIEHNPGMGFMGMERFDLWKVTEGG